ncbi:S-layer homology domain-containing protein [Candidatus Saganbacteria bacterium]|nr:S-layer homology domain-containing protein [Candidatus Saganbacteria bacterium]
MKKFLFLLVFIVLICSFSWAISADIGEIGVGARPLGLGKAYAGFAGDASAIFLNPAGLCENSEMNIISMSGKLLNEISYISLGITNPVSFGTLGFGYINAGTSGIPLTTLSVTTTEVVINQYGATDYSSAIYYLSFANNLTSNLSYGTNIKVFTQGFSQTTGSLEGGTGLGTDLDFGIKWKPRNAISAGIMLQNILPTTFGGKFSWKSGFEEAIPAVVKVGSSFNVLGDDGFRAFRDQKLLFNLDLEMMPLHPRPGVWHAGLEYWLNPWLALRAGLDQKPKATESGIGIDNNMTGGVTLKHRGFSFDYAYHQYGDLTDNIAHFFSIGFQAEKEPKKLKEIIKEKVERIFKTELKEAKGLKHFNDIDEDYWAKDSIEYLAALGIMAGYPDNSFHPEQPLTRAELAALLVKAKGFEAAKPDQDLFPDVNIDHWAAPYIDMALKRKYISGYPDLKFRPWKEVVRAEAIVVFSKFAGLMEPSSISTNPFPDITQNHWAARFITAAKQAGLLEYLSGYNFEPEKSFTRAEAAEVLSKTEFAKEKIKELLKK